MKELGHPYKKVGRITMTVARKAHIKAADIYVSENYLRHITNRHTSELAELGISAFDFVTLICNNFNQVRKGSGDSYLLVIYNPDLPLVAAISLNFSVRKGFWEIKTAEPRRCSTVEKSALIWEAAKHTSSGNG